MKILPTLAEVREIASDVNYNVLPVSCEILSDFTTPIEIIKILKNVSTHCYMLESAQANETWGRYTFLGFDPKMEITCVDGEMKIGNLKLKTEHPSDYLRQILADYKSPRFDYLPPFTGGLVGYFSYDYLGYSEPTVKCDAKDTEDFKDVDLMLFDKVIAFDHLRQKIVLIVNMPLDDVEVRYNKAVMELKRLIELLRNGEKRGEPGGKLLGEVTSLFGKEQFCAMVEKAKHHIHEGNIFQIVLSNRLSAPFEGSLLNTYRVLRTINPSPYMFYFSGTDVEVAGASPETLVKLVYFTPFLSLVPDREEKTMRKIKHWKQSCLQMKRSWPNIICWLTLAETILVKSVSLAPFRWKNCILLNDSPMLCTLALLYGVK
jgi:anthranilate synthase component 1